MKKIIGVIRPFEMKQTLMVYEDGNKIDLSETTITDLSESMLALMEKHSTYQADLVGPKKFILGLKSEIMKDTKLKYEETPDIEINII